MDPIDYNDISLDGKFRVSYIYVLSGRVSPFKLEYVLRLINLNTEMFTLFLFYVSCESPVN